MKYLPVLAIFVCASLVLSSAAPNLKTDISPLNGAWKNRNGSDEELLLIADGYCMLTTYDKTNKRFIKTMGGPFTTEKNKLHFKVHFNSADINEVGKTHEVTYQINGNSLSVSTGETTMTWQRADDGKNSLAGNWRITKRKNGTQVTEIPLRPRRTLKLLTGKYFQWAAINIETGEFSGTGGGTYTFENGKYTEQIDFFSRDNTRVGVSLNFEGKLQGTDWIHTGLSSKGDPIHEIWSRFKE